MRQHPLKKHIDEIIPLTDEEFEYVLSHFIPVYKSKHQYLIQEGELVNKEFWVVKGALKSYFFDDKAKEHILQFALENWWTTDYHAFHNRTESRIYVDCLEDTELLYITIDNREKLSREMHKMESFWAVKTQLGYIALQNRVLSLLKNTAKERSEMLLKQYPEFFQRFPKKLIASYLGVSRETLSRLYS